MATILSHIRYIAGALAIACLVALAAPASAVAQQINPTADAVQEQKLLSELNRITGRCTLPDQKACTLEQPAGRDWRYFHQQTLPIIGAVSIIGMLVLLVLFYMIRGMVRIEHGRSGRVIVRFSMFERLVHWMTATCFIILALSGLNITFGKQVLMPLIGEQSFAEVSQWLKYSHNYLSFPFTLGVVLMFLMWIAWNIPSKVDVNWIREGGGLVGDRHPPAARFNAGQKMIYWVVVLGGARRGGERLSADVPVLRHQYRRHAVGADGPRHRRDVVHRRDAGAHLHRHHRDGRRRRGDVERYGRRQLGEGAPQPVAGAGRGQGPRQWVAAGRPDAAGRIAGRLSRHLQTMRPPPDNPAAASPFELGRGRRQACAPAPARARAIVSHTREGVAGMSI